MSLGSISRGLFFTFFFAILFVAAPIKKISTAISLFSAAAAPAKRIFTLLDEKIEVTEIKKPKKLKEFKNSVSYEKVSFSYPNTNTQALKNISFQIQQGEHAAIVGSSGAGKSTIVDLFMRLYDVTSGNIRIDGVDIRELSLENLRSFIGVMSQDVFLFNASAAENISCGSKHNISQTQIEKAAHEANAHDFIKNLEHGYETLIGERGVLLSGGQCQRIAMARVLLLDPPILILDEATSSLDNESEALIQNTLKKVCAGRTVITIAHRLFCAKFPSDFSYGKWTHSRRRKKSRRTFAKQKRLL